MQEQWTEIIEIYRPVYILHGHPLHDDEAQGGLEGTKKQKAESGCLEDQNARTMHLILSVEALNLIPSKQCQDRPWMLMEKTVDGYPLQNLPLDFQYHLAASDYLDEAVGVAGEVFCPSTGPMKWQNYCRWDQEEVGQAPCAWEMKELNHKHAHLGDRVQRNGVCDRYDWKDEFH